MNPRFWLLLVASLAVAPVYAEDAVERLTRGMPQPVVAFIERAVNCNHWAGEPAYDAARAKAIAKAVADLKCSRLDADQTRLLRRYRGNAGVERAVREARDLSL